MSKPDIYRQAWERLCKWRSVFAGTQSPYLTPVTRLFQRAWSHKPPLPVVEAAPLPEAKAPKRPREKPDAVETLSELLDFLHGSFDVLKLPNNRISSLTKLDMKALRIIGVHVPHPWLLLMTDDESSIRVDVSKGLPNTVCISMTNRSAAEQRERDQVPFVIFFAIKQAKIPPYFTQHIGTPYVFGFGLLLGEHKHDTNDKLTWFAMMGTIDQHGEIRFCDELRTRNLKIRCKTPAARRAFGPTRTVHRRAWDTAWLLKMSDRSLDKTRLIQKNVIRQGFAWWSGRTERWSVAVTRNKDRVTFGINPENTKRFFADRDKTAKANDGRAKKIIHYVRAHDRTLANGNVVSIKEHIRGLREFDWQEFHCLVTAPQFHGALISAIFDVPPIDLEDMPPDVDCLDAVQVASELVRIEDKDNRDARVAAETMRGWKP